MRRRRLADRGGGRQARAHGASRIPRLAQGQRRLGAAHRADAPDRVPRPRHRLPGPDRQQDQRHHLPPLAVPGQPGLDRAHRRGARRARAGRSGPPARSSSRWRADAEFVAAARRRCAAPTRRRWSRLHPPYRGHRGAIRRRCSTCRSSASTNTSASCSTSWRRSRCTRRSAPSPTADWVPRVKIFAGKAAASYAHAKLIIKLANDVARVVNADPVVRRPAASSCSCRTTTSAWPKRSSRRRICPSRSRPPAWRPRAPAT